MNDVSMKEHSDKLESLSKGFKDDNRMLADQALQGIDAVPMDHDRRSSVKACIHERNYEQAMSLLMSSADYAKLLGLQPPISH